MMTGFWCSFFALLLSTTTISLSGGYSTQEDLERLGVANNYLALNILRQLTAESSENIFFSPLSLSTVFGMLQYGTRGGTAQELRKALGYDTAGLQDELLHPTFRWYLTLSLLSKDPSVYVIHTANAILLDKRLNLLPSYKRDAQILYQAPVQDVDFAFQAPQVVDEINRWVQDKTNGKIDHLLEELDPSTAVLLLNAVYFKGIWQHRFNPRKTRPQTFFNNGLESGAREVPMMRKTELLRYANLDSFGALEMPYRGVNISMLVLLPHDRNGLQSLESSLTLQDLSTIRQQMLETRVILTIPKFKMQYSKDMTTDFQSLGVTSIFTPGGDFSGMTQGWDVFVSQVLHKAVIEVNEDGSEAAAATAVISNRMMSGEYFVVDHPFLFAIVDKRYDVILFLGRVTSL